MQASRVNPNSQRIRGHLLESSPTKSPKKVYRLPEAKVFSFVLRRFTYARLRKVFGVIKSTRKSKITNFLVFNDLIKQRLVASFNQVVKFSKLRQLQKISWECERVDRGVLAVSPIFRRYHKAINEAFNKLRTATTESSRFRVVFAQILINSLSLTLGKKMLRQGFRSLSSRQQFRDYKILKASKFIKSLCYFEKRFLKDKLDSIIICTESRLYSQMYAQSQLQRRRLYEYQNKKTQFMAGERQQLMQLKIAIEQETQQKNVKTTEMRRENNIRRHQLEIRLKQISGVYAQKCEILARCNRQLSKEKLKCQSRQLLASHSKESRQKVRSVYLQILSEPVFQIRSSSRIILTKQKFHTRMPEVESFKKQSNQYQLYLNIAQRSLVCLFQGVPLEDGNPSQEYLQCLEENSALKQMLHCLVGDQLRAQQLDGRLQQLSGELERLFEPIFERAEGEQCGERSVDMRESLLSYRTDRVRKRDSRESSIRGSALSIKSIK